MGLKPQVCLPRDMGRSLKIWLVAGHGGAHIFNSRQRQVYVYEFMASLVYTKQDCIVGPYLEA